MHTLPLLSGLALGDIVRAYEYIVLLVVLGLGHYCFEYNTALLRDLEQGCFVMALFCCNWCLQTTLPPDYTYYVLTLMSVILW